MNSKYSNSLLKHFDFILLDIICLQVCYIFSFWINRGYGNPYADNAYQYQAVILFAGQLVVDIFFNNYSGILRRSAYDEAIEIIKYLFKIIVIALFYLFIVHRSNVASRLQFGVTSVLFFFIGLAARQLLKKWLLRSTNAERNKKSVVLITGVEYVDEIIKQLTREDTVQDYVISDILLLDKEDIELPDLDYPVHRLSDESLYNISHNWVDEVFYLQPENTVFPKELMESLLKMGITVNYTLAEMNEKEWGSWDIQKIGNYKVFSSGVRFATVGEMAIKRTMDIIGSLVGCVLTAVIFVFIAPIIYKESPGPIFFVQERVGKNGKLFKMYKFRSMYLDAEERKEALMDQNTMSDGFMFKMDNDPRIIGSEKKNAKGESVGIGNFIRKTSLDEFPQFFNVLKGDMSLVGWRPATKDEWDRYEFQHRIRASMKPGITGLWQVSGRSEITDFDEVVKLDKEYLENWNLYLDIKILLKTVIVLFKRTGAK